MVPPLRFAIAFLKCSLYATNPGGIGLMRISRHTQRYKQGNLQKMKCGCRLANQG